MVSREQEAPVVGKGSARRTQAAPVFRLDSHLMTLAALVWVAFLAAEVALLWNPVSVRVLGEFSVVDRATLIAAELVALVPFSMLLAWCLDWFSTLGSGKGGRATSGVGMVMAGLLGGASALLFGISWLVFRVSGAFLDGTGVRMWLASPAHMAEHGLDLAADSFFMLPLFFVIGCLVLGYAVPFLARRLSVPSRRSLNRKFLLLNVLLLLLAVRGGNLSLEGTVRMSDPQAGAVYSAADRYRQVRAEQTGPAVRTLFSLWRALSGTEAHGLAREEGVEVRWNPLEPMDRYVNEATAGRSPGADDPSVIVILVESLRPDQLEAYGGPRSVMPHVDSLAQDARVFLDVYTQSSHSNYADLPPLNSHYPLRSSRLHVYPEEVPYPRVLLYDILKEFGYRTAIFSSQNESWGGMANYLATGSLDEFFHAGTYRGPTYVPEGDPGFAGYARRANRAGKIDDSATVEAAIDWIRSEPETPFFMYMNLQNSHAPYRTPADFPRRFGPDSIDFEVRFGAFPVEKVDVVKDLYASSLAYVDDQLGKLFRALKISGRWGRTVVIVTGDTGQAFYEHGFAAHAGPLFDEVVRVPLVVRAPDLAPARDSLPAEHVDVPPTVLDILGLPSHPSFQGHSLLEATGPSNGGRYVVAQSPLAHQYAVILDGWKLIYDVRRDSKLLFDLEGDPGETADLSRQRANRREMLERRLGTWMRAQLEYYEVPSRYEGWYPPKLLVPDDHGAIGDGRTEGGR